MDLVVGDRTVKSVRCDRCGRTYGHVTGFVWNDGEPWAVYFAACHGHPEHEAWIDVVLGTWGEDDAAGHVTLSCRLAVEGAQAVDGPVAVEGTSGILGERLNRDDALAHPRIGDFWDVVDAIAAQDQDVRKELASSGET
jgi:hypothetical protein